MQKPVEFRRRVIVRVAYAAFWDLLYSAVEAAVVPQELTEDSLDRLTVWDRSRKGRRVRASELPPTLAFSRSGLETTGILAGRKMVVGEETEFRIERAFPITGVRNDHSVGHHCRSPELLDELAAALDARFEVVGGFHSHPLCEFEIADIDRDKRFMPSVSDVEGGPMFWGREINLVVSVAKAGGLKPAPVTRPGPILQTRIGAFQFWFVAHQYRNDAIVLEIDTRPATATPPIGNWQRRPPPPF